MHEARNSILHFNMSDPYYPIAESTHSFQNSGSDYEALLC